MQAEGILTFWGCRGSIPSPSLQTIVFGGNSACVSVEYQEHVLIFDAGSGVRKLGNYLLTRPDINRLKGSMFITHAHWDHINGLPFFKPAFSQENQFVIYGEGTHKHSLVGLLESQMQAPFFPVGMEVFHAHIDFREVREQQTIAIGDEISVTPFRLSHPNATLGYLLHIEDARLAYVTDHEHPVEQISPNVAEMVHQTDILIHDAQYTREQLKTSKKGWGHSAWEDVVDLAIAEEVGQLFLFHHDPDSTDEELDERQYQAQRLFPPTFVAREGLKVPIR